MSNDSVGKFDRNSVFHMLINFEKFEKLEFQWCQGHHLIRENILAE